MITCMIDADTEQISDNIHFHRTMHFHHPNSSSHTLQTMHGDDDERASLLSSNSNSSNSYGAATPSNAPNTRRIVFNATLKMAAIFVCGSLFLGGTLWLSLPPLEECVHPPLVVSPDSHVAVEPTATCYGYQSPLSNCSN